MFRRPALLALCALAFAACDEDTPARPPLTADELLDPEACRECHPSHVQEWSGSMHAYAGDDPVFRAMNARGQRETEGALGDFCVQCHAPLALRLGLAKGDRIVALPPVKVERPHHRLVPGGQTQSTVGWMLHI